MNRERALLARVLTSELWSVQEELQAEIKKLLAQPEQGHKFNFDLERMKAAIESPISDVTVDDLAKQVKQEPVAWMWEDKRNGSNSWATVVSPAKPEKCEYHVRNIRPLYLASPKRESLSTDTMLRLISEHQDFPLNLARAVERECGIGGGE